MKRALVLVLAAACTSSPDATSSKQTSARPAGGAASKPAAASQPNAAEAPVSPVLLEPSKASLTAPAKFTAKLETTKGDVMVEVTRAWAPNGADRFYNLVKAGYYDDTAFFRVIGGFMAQIGISGRPDVNKVWRDARIPDDPVKQSNLPGYVTFAAASMPNSRTTQFFVNFGNNSRLDGMRFAPFGRIKDMTVMKKIYAGYGEGAPRGRGPAQGRLQAEGNPYLKADFPEMDYVKKATIVSETK